MHARRILAKAGDFYPQLVSALERHGGRGLWIHFSDIPKVGIRPDPAHKDPVGIYFFPLDHMAADFGRYHHWAFRRYMFVCRVDADSVLDLSAVTVADMESMLAEVGVEEGSEAWSAGYLYGGSPGGRLWRALDETAREGGEWGAGRGMAFRRLLKRLGYDAVRDPGTGTIHSSEPDQLLVLDPGDVEVVEMVETTTRPYDADAYYRDPKYPFRGRSTKPALELLRALASAISLEPARVTSHGKGSWAMSARDAAGNEIRLAEELHTSGAADYVSFRAKFSASWHSDGMQVYEAGDGPHGHGYEFGVHSDYNDVVAPFAEQLRAKMAETPLDDTSYIEGPLREIADAIGGAKVSAESPVRGTLRKRVGASELRVSLGFEHPESSYRAKEPSYDVSGVVALPRSPAGEMAINPSFGHDIGPIPAGSVVREVIKGLPRWIREVMERHFPEGDARYDHIRRHTAPVLEFLERRAAPAKAARLASRYHRVSRSLSPGRRERVKEWKLERQRSGNEMPSWQEVLDYVKTTDGWENRLEAEAHMVSSSEDAEDAAEAHWGRFGKGMRKVLFRARVDLGNVDLRGTVFARMEVDTGPDEREIRFLKHAPIWVHDATLGDGTVVEIDGWRRA